MRSGGEKYQYAWEGTIEFDEEEHDYFRGAFLEFKFPSVTGETLPPPYPLIPDDLKPDIPDALSPIFDQETRGYGLVVNSQFVIVPDIKPNPDCTRESCRGSLV